MGCIYGSKRREGHNASTGTGDDGPRHFRGAGFGIDVVRIGDVGSRAHEGVGVRDQRPGSDSVVQIEQVRFVLVFKGVVSREGLEGDGIQPGIAHATLVDFGGGITGKTIELIAPGERMLSG